jgi:formylglycine-generating enzyme
MKHLSLAVAVIVSVGALTSCKNGGIFKKKPQSSQVTGWNYNDKKEGGFNVAKSKDIKTGPGLVFVQGGTFTMGATQEDVMAEWNNVPKRITVNSFMIDKTEVANVHYREYLHWVENVFGTAGMEAVVDACKPDTLVWRSELSYNEPYVEYYFRHPAYNYYPVVGVSWKQAKDFCVWRTDRVNQKELIKKGFQNKNVLKQELNGGGQDNFNTKSYLMGEYSGIPSKPKSKKDQLVDANGKPRNYVQFSDGIILPDYRLPTEAEWEYAALGYISENPAPRKNEKKRGEELVANKSVYSWKNENGYDNLRAVRRGNWQGAMLANFKRGNGDYMGTAGGLNDRAVLPGPIESYFPNAFGLYNMSGNVAEWVSDVYRPMTGFESDDFNPVRGNTFQKVDMAGGQGNLRDTLGRIKMIMEDDKDLRNRRNYQQAYAVNYMDGDSLSAVFYGYGVTTLISDKSRVYKGGSWMDMPYYLSPGTRRMLEEDQASSTVGFRCAMTHFGSTEGKGRKDGNFFPKRRQKR